jgi:glycerol-3-phosphate dehydrogenase
MAQRPEWRAELTPSTPTVGAEIIFAIRHEMAVHLADIVLRRTALGAAGYPGADEVQKCAWLAAGELGWDPSRVAVEVAEIDQFYRI